MEKLRLKAFLTCPPEASGLFALPDSWLWGPRGGTLGVSFEVLYEDSMCLSSQGLHVWGLAAPHRQPAQEFNKHFLLVHVSISLDGLPTISTFLLLSNSGMVWD